MGAGVEIGMVEPDANEGVIADLSGLMTSALSLRAGWRLTDDDELALSLTQPPRVERGRARLDIPVGRTKDGTVLHESFTTDLTPSGRQIDLAVHYGRTGVFGGELRTQGYVSRDPGHTDTKPVLGLLAGWRITF